MPDWQNSAFPLVIAPHLKFLNKKTVSANDSINLVLLLFFSLLPMKSGIEIPSLYCMAENASQLLLNLKKKEREGEFSTSFGIEHFISSYHLCMGFTMYGVASRKITTYFLNDNT